MADPFEGAVDPFAGAVDPFAGAVDPFAKSDPSYLARVLKGIPGGIEGSVRGLADMPASLLESAVSGAGKVTGLDNAATQLNKGIDMTRPSQYVPKATSNADEAQQALSWAIENAAHWAGNQAAKPITNDPNYGLGKNINPPPTEADLLASENARRSVAEGVTTLAANMAPLGEGKVAGLFRKAPLSAEELALLAKMKETQPAPPANPNAFPTLNEPPPPMPHEQVGTGPQTPLPQINQPLLDQVPNQQPLPFVPEVPLTRDFNQLFDSQEPAGTPPPPAAPLPPSAPVQGGPVPTHPEPITAEANPERLTGVNHSPEVAPQIGDGTGNNVFANKAIRETPFDTTPQPTQPGIDFPLRQEVIEQHQPTIDAFREEHQNITDQINKATDPTTKANLIDAKTQLENEFGAGMKQLGVDQASDAYGRKLYEQGQGTKLPIETTDRQALPSESDRPFTSVTDPDKLTIGGKFAKQLTSDEVAQARSAKPISSRTFMGRQRGAVNFGLFGKSIPLEDRLRIAKGQLDSARSDHLQALEDTENAKQSGDLNGYREGQKTQNVTLENLTYAEDHHNRLEQAASQPKAPVTQFVPKNQRGSFGDPKFKAFKDSLPEAMKPRASVMYKEWVKQQGRQAPIETTPGQNHEKVVADLPGMSHLTSEVAPVDEIPLEQLKPQMIAQGDPGIGWLRKNIASGADLTGFKTGSLVVRRLGDIANNAFRRAEVNIRTALLDKNSGLKPMLDHLTPSEKGELHTAMRALEGKEGVPNLRPKLMDVWEQYRKVMDDTFGKINEARVSLGLKELPPRPNYMPNIWRGDFHIPVLDGTGKYISSITAPTKYQALNIARIMKREHPEYTYQPSQYRPISKLSGDIETGWRELAANYSESDPAFKTFQEAYAKVFDKYGFDALGVKKHFEFKRKEGVQGYEGGKDWISPNKNAKQGFQASMKYIEQSMKWSEIQKANTKIKEMLTDPDIRKAQPSAVAYGKYYWDRAMGKQTQFAHAINTITDLVGEFLGLGRSLDVSADRILKGALTMKFLGFNNFAFAGSQSIQPVQMLPHWMNYLERRGGANSALASAKALYDLHALPSARSESGAAALAWAKTNHIFDSQMIDTIRDNTAMSKIGSFGSKMATMLPSKVESYSRAMFFMHMFHQIDLAGVHGTEAYRTAAKLTDMGMTNYKLHERPLMYRALGNMGDLASALTSFKHNQFTQLDAFNVAGRRINLAPMMAMQFLAAGVTGFYGEQEIDNLLHAINWATSTFNINPLKGFDAFKDDAYIPTIKSKLLEKAPDWVTFGGVSQLTHMDMSSRFSASQPLPENYDEFMFPFYKDVGKMTEDLKDLAMQRNATAMIKAVHEFSPNSAKWITEEMDKAPNGMYINPDNDQGAYPREKWDRAARALGGYSMDEAKSRDIAYENMDRAEWVQTLKGSIMKTLVTTYDPKTLGDLASQFTKLNPSVTEVNTFQTAMFDHLIGQNMSSRDRSAGIPSVVQERGMPTGSTIMKLQQDKQFPRNVNGQ